MKKLLFLIISITLVMTFTILTSKASVVSGCAIGSYEKNGITYNRKCTIVYDRGTNLKKGLSIKFTVSAESIDSKVTSAYVEGANDFTIVSNFIEDIELQDSSNTTTAVYSGESKTISDQGIAMAYVYYMSNTETESFLYYDINSVVEDSSIEDSGNNGNDYNVDNTLSNGNTSTDDKKCDIKDGKYYGPNGELLEDKAAYDKVCGSKNYKDGYGNPYVLLGFGVALIAGVITVRKKNKLFN